MRFVSPPLLVLLLLRSSGEERRTILHSGVFFFFSVQGVYDGVPKTSSLHAGEIGYLNRGLFVVAALAYSFFVFPREVGFTYLRERERESDSELTKGEGTVYTHPMARRKFFALECS